MKPDDRDRVYQARRILFKNINNPLSVVELAATVGINECYLQEGFRQLFGDTVFGCLRDYRMKEAQRLLSSENITIAGVAAAVGYASPTAFNAAFRKKFDISPKVYQIKMRGKSLV
ncbi:helix-turn-helix transcriptional regulator [Nostoc sp.]|uniref:helix-turn-helix transcriptional regulator n=1 Tax=Nostoc sp. TaxID=1180 RepID=UPI002FF6572D